MSKTSNPDKSIRMSSCFKALYTIYDIIYCVLLLYGDTHTNIPVILSLTQF